VVGNGLPSHTLKKSLLGRPKMWPNESLFDDLLLICTKLMGLAPSPHNINSEILNEIAKKLQILKKILDEIARLWMKTKL